MATARCWSIRFRTIHMPPARPVIFWRRGRVRAELVPQLLSFSRRQMLQPETIEIYQLIQSVERMLRRIIREHIEIRTVLDPVAGWIRADVNQMEAVLLNLATNSQDAMVHGGTLSIETAHVEVTPDGPIPECNLTTGSYICLCVTDTGHGMDADTLQH